nr:PREDICTED: uncharacterized protein LOC106704677 [Latimeria chalumnae]|eukprot:XP_014347725.1 PREDICTED: uncharacterized protein LOC106704677 [Latimeria chalumnae]
MIRQFHDGMYTRVWENRDASEPFSVTNGVKQGCVLAPTLFSVLFAAFNGMDEGIYIQSRTDGKLFNLRRLKAFTRLLEILVRELLFADNCALVSHTQAGLQKTMDCFTTSTKRYCLTVRLKKTKIMFQPAPAIPYIPPIITIDGTALAVVDKFTYLGSTMSRNVLLDKVSHRIAKATSVFGSFRDELWNKRGIQLSTKLQVYQAVVVPMLLYACKTWTPYYHHTTQLDRFHLTCLCKIMIKWQEKIPNTEVLSRAGMTGIEGYDHDSPVSLGRACCAHG